MVTQRRIRSIYHRNVDIAKQDQMLDWDLSPWAHASALTPLQEDLWQEILTTGFEFLADDSVPQPDLENMSELTNPLDQEEATQNLDQQDVSVDKDLLVQSVPACGFCRTQHIKCDRKFPSCGACAKSDRACLFYDAVLQKNVLRRFVRPHVSLYFALN